MGLKKIQPWMFDPIPMSRDQAVGLSERLVAATTLTSSLEYLVQLKEIRQGGLNDWSITNASQAHSTPWTRRLLNLVSAERTTTALHAARAAVSAAMFLPSRPSRGRWRGPANVFLSATTAALYPRHRYGTDGSDQVSILVQAANGAVRIARRSETKDAFMWLVALQANLSYLVSGWVKTLGQPWRDGSALGGIMRTKTYGHRPTFDLTQRHPVAAKRLAHGVLALECFFPVAYLAGGRLARPIIASAVSFHMANGFLMGLGRFVTAFTSMHPMVAYTSAPKTHPAVAGRDDRAVATAAVLLAGAASVAGAVAVQRRSRVLEGWPSSRTITTRHGNTLQYEVGSGADEGKPLLVFSAGLAATSEHFGWITEKVLEESDYGVLTYARAGYAGSRRRSASPYRLSESVDDLIDLIHGAVPPERQVVLVGHSLGGELARRAAAELGEKVHAVVYLDSSHPGELNRSAQQSETGKRLAESLDQMVWSLRLGMGILMSRPDWLEKLPTANRPRVFAQYADVRLWEAARREWGAVEADFRSFHDDLVRLDAHALVVSAQQTVDRDPEQLLMHNELAGAHRGGTSRVATVVVEGANHDSLLTDSRFAHQVADRIITFLNATQTSVDITPSADDEEDEDVDVDVLARSREEV